LSMSMVCLPLFWSTLPSPPSLARRPFETLLIVVS
jgi:hypothetical protein